MITATEYIESILEKQKISKNPKKYIVLRNWNEVVDHDMTYQVNVDPLPCPVPVGTVLWVIARSDSPDLIEAKVVEDRYSDGLFIEPLKVRVQYLVPREDARQTPIPYRPLAIRRTDLRLFIGDGPATEWHAARARRILAASKQR